MRKCLIIVFFLIGTFSFGQRSDFESISFQKADSIAVKYSRASLENLPVLTYHLTSDLHTDVEKFRAIYTWVCTNIKNDYSSYQKTIRKRKKFADDAEALTDWNDKEVPKVFENLIKYKKTACTGYAYIVREMASLADLNCKIINGYGRTANTILNEKSIPNHSWNTVELNNKLYLCDPTWSAGRIYIDEDGARFEADYFDGYFLAEPELFIKNHYPIEIEASLLTNPPTLKQFIEGPIIYKEAFKINVFPVAPLNMNLTVQKNELVEFTLDSAENLLDASMSLVIFNGKNTEEITPDLKQTKNTYTFNHFFEKAGQYDVHLKVNEMMVATFVVRVKR